MTEIEVAALELSKAFWRLYRYGYINANHESEEGQVAHWKGIGFDASDKIIRLLKHRLSDQSGESR